MNWGRPILHCMLHRCTAQLVYGHGAVWKTVFFKQSCNTIQFKADIAFVQSTALCNKTDLRNCCSKWVKPPPEGLCLPSTPQLWRCEGDAQPASPWTRPESPAHCCYGHWGWRWFPSLRRPALHGGTSHLNSRIDVKITSAGIAMSSKYIGSTLLTSNMLVFHVCWDILTFVQPKNNVFLQSSKLMITIIVEYYDTKKLIFSEILNESKLGFRSKCLPVM